MGISIREDRVDPPAPFFSGLLYTRVSARKNDNIDSIDLAKKTAPSPANAQSIESS